MYTRKLTVALALVIVCLMVLVSASYAWVIMSTRPEVTGINTHIGANGSLEIALLNKETFMDPSLIQTQIGDSAVRQDTVASNGSWGNVLDLGDESYGLGQISMIPARLNFEESTVDSGTVAQNLLIYAEYGLDGRISTFFDETTSGVFMEDSFKFDMSSQNYGVRGVGTATDLSPMQLALSGAKTAVPAYANAAKRSAISAWEEYGDTLMDVYYKRYRLGYMDSTEEHRKYTQEERQEIIGMLEATLRSYDYLDAMMREYFIGLAATQFEDSGQFETLCTMIKKAPMITAIIKPAGALIPQDVQVLMHNLDATRMNLQYSIQQLKALPEEDCCWSDICYNVDDLLAADEYGYVRFNQGDLRQAESFGTISADNVLTVDKDSGALAMLTEFVGAYSTFFKWDENVSVEIRVRYSEVPAAQEFAETLEEARAAGNILVNVGKIRDICGFAVDLAFRCNTKAQLLLQTDPTARVENGDEKPGLQGGGSVMKFTSDELEAEQIVKLMDGIRVGFLDDQCRLLGVAKLNTSNYEESKDGVSAPLYLYEFQISDDGALTMGERMAENSPIMALPKSTATIMTAVVWLDGEFVDNAMASTTGMSVTGSLNLQFSTDAELVASNQNVEIDD